MDIAPQKRAKGGCDVAAKLIFVKSCTLHTELMHASCQNFTGSETYKQGIYT